MELNRLHIPQCTMIKGIPLAFDESLSWLEQVCAILKKLNETIEQVNKNTKWIEGYEDQYEEIQREITLINERLVILQDDLNSKASKSELQTAISNLNNELRSLISSEYSILKEYVDTEFENLQYQIDHIDVGNIMLYDPTTGNQSPIQVVIDNIYDQTRTEAITAGEFDNLELSATEFDSKEITAFNFDRYGKTLLSE